MPSRSANAKSDAATMMDIRDVEPLLEQVKQLADLRAGWPSR